MTVRPPMTCSAAAKAAATSLRMGRLADPDDMGGTWPAPKPGLGRQPGRRGHAHHPHLRPSDPLGRRRRRHTPASGASSASQLSREQASGRRPDVTGTPPGAGRSDALGSIAAWSAGVSADATAFAALLITGDAAWQRALFICLTLIGGCAFALLICARVPIFKSSGQQGHGALHKGDSPASHDPGEPVPCQNPHTGSELAFTGLVTLPSSTR
jgi:hypothetical protein